MLLPILIKLCCNVWCAGKDLCNFLVIETVKCRKTQLKEFFVCVSAFMTCKEYKKLRFAGYKKKTRKHISWIKNAIYFSLLRYRSDKSNQFFAWSLKNALPEVLVQFFYLLNVLLGNLSMQRFWTLDGNWKYAVFLFNLSFHCHIYIVESPFTCRDDKKNLGETTDLKCKMFTSNCRPWLKNVAYLQQH